MNLTGFETARMPSTREWAAAVLGVPQMTVLQWEKLYAAETSPALSCRWVAY